MAHFAWAAAFTVAAALVAVIAYAWLTPSTTNSAEARPGPSSVGSSVTSHSPTPVATSSVTTAPSVAQTSSASSTPRDVGPLGLTVAVTVESHGTLVVTERLAASLPATIRFGEPRKIDGAGIPTGESALPVVGGLTARLDGQAVAVTRETEQRWSVATTAGTHVLALSYRITGATVSTKLAPTGRATVAIVAMLRALARAVPITMTVSDSPTAEILGLNCPVAPAPDAVCGNRLTSGWHAVFSPAQYANSALLTAQANITG